jgi:hypothetical protein
MTGRTKAAAGKKHRHEVVVRVHLNRAVTARQARYAVWNAINGLSLYGAGDEREPWSRAHIQVPRNRPRCREGTGSGRVLLEIREERKRK